MGNEELTEQETALYDRQIRVWGVDAQRRLSKSHILVSGLRGTVVEFCKNIVLAGVGSLTLNDDRPEFNPMVRVSVQKGDLSSFGINFFDQFDVVVVSCCTLSTKKSVNEKCHKLSKRVAYYTVDCRDSCGEIFVDLQNYTYSKKKLQETIECLLQYPTFEDAIAIPWRSLPKRLSKLYFAMRGTTSYSAVLSSLFSEWGLVLLRGSWKVLLGRDKHNAFHNSRHQKYKNLLICA
ncbi:unnamed protein product [Ilex paraguariensis]|uniref:THIF-type NAD/FAD binding fold domain-containing protein n=1 Tax=Ilex paraguariensis TaxID=185542 RepID=A0ABC8UQ56_9AQUA